MLASEIRRFLPTARPELVNAIVAGWDKAVEAGINSPRRTQHFMARVAVETGGLRAVSESLNYTPEGLTATFSRKRISVAQAQRLGRRKGHPADQEGIANQVYGGEWGKKNLGNTRPGDGWRYRGGGMLQTTGRANYKKQGFESNPDALRDPATAFATAVREWEKRGCSAAADKDDAAAVCLKINGGTNGLAEQRTYLAKAKKVWPGGTTPVTREPVRGFMAREPEYYGDTDDGPAAAEPVVDAELVQRRLRELGYVFAGKVDGNPGDLTEAAVMSFKRINGLEPITPEPDDEFMRVLVSADAVPFPIPEGRENITEADLRAEGSKTITRADAVENVGNVGVATGAVGGVVAAASSAFSTVREYIYPVQEFFQNIPGFVWFGIIVVAAVYIVWKTRRIKAGRVESAREMRTFSAEE